MKKTIMCGLLTLGVMGLQAQSDTTNNKDVEIKVLENSVTIELENLNSLSSLDLNKVVREISETAAAIQRQRQEMLAQIDKQEANGEITAEEAEEMREMINERTEENMELLGDVMELWGENYEAQWEAWEEKYEAEMEAWEEQYEANIEAGRPVPPVPPVPPFPKSKAPDTNTKTDTIRRSRKIIISDDGIEIHEGKEGDKPFAFRFKDDDDGNDSLSPGSGDRKRKKIKTTTGYFDINFGFNVQMEDGQFIVVNDPAELNLWKSTQFELGAGWKTRLGNPYSKWYLKYGLEISWHNFRLKGDNTLQTTDSLAFFASDNEKQVTRSKYLMTYFNVPVMFQLDFSDVGKTDDAFTLGLGGYAGVRVDFDRKIDFKNALNQEVEEDTDGDFFTNQFRYGLMAQLGFDSFKITAKYDLNSFFQEDRGPNYNMASIAIGLTL